MGETELELLRQLAVWLGLCGIIGACLLFIWRDAMADREEQARATGQLRRCPADPAHLCSCETCHGFSLGAGR